MRKDRFFSLLFSLFLFPFSVREHPQRSARKTLYAQFLWYRTGAHLPPTPLKTMGPFLLHRGRYWIAWPILINSHRNNSIVPCRESTTVIIIQRPPSRIRFRLARYIIVSKRMSRCVWHGCTLAGVSLAKLNVTPKLFFTAIKKRAKIWYTRRATRQNFRPKKNFIRDSYHSKNAFKHFILLFFPTSLNFFLSRIF